MKRIKDSVHGNILVRDEFVKTILDTPSFQRLRRVEQTAIRSIFPSARHDRFIHSLGVYYIGQQIAEHLVREFFKDGKDNYEGYSNEAVDCIVNSYLVACLLHDIAHAPFSHTFEKYYGQKQTLFDLLNSELSNRLDDELKNIENPNYHEYASAIVVCKEFKPEVIEKVLKADMELVCRMIIGAYYKKEKKEHELHNCFISLLHGDVVDADRIDYACRDVWASGYSTSSIDVDRVVSSIHIKREPKTQELCVCFDCNGLTEIRNMLDVRQFQNRYVINHHSVQYEQKLMVMAAEKAALEIYKDAGSGAEALQRIVHIDRCHSGNYFSDEDLLQVMKSDSGNTYYQEYSSRQYKRFAVWKTPDEFFHFFPDIPRKKDLTHAEFEEKVRKALAPITNAEDIIILDVTYKPAINLKSLYLIVNEDMVRYTDIHPELQVDLGDCEVDLGFYYIYVPKPEDPTVNLDEERKKIAELLKPVFDDLYPASNAEYRIYDFMQTAMIKGFELLYKDNPEEAEKKKKQVREMSKNITRLEDFFNASGLKGLVEKF